jgi:uncharacterized protein
MKPLLLVSMLAATLLAQNPAEPAKFEVPAVETRPLRIDRLVLVRMKNGTDLLKGLEEAIRREKIRSAVIVSAIGSVTSYHVHVVDNKTLPPKDAYLKADEPMDIGSTQGYVIDGRLHCHIVLGDKKRTFAGHLEPGNKVFTFAAITLAVLDAGELEGIDDWKRH